MSPEETDKSAYVVNLERQLAEAKILLKRAHWALGWALYDFQQLRYQGGLVCDISDLKDAIEKWRTDNA